MSVLDLQRNEVIKTIKLNGTPVGITKSTNEDYIFVSDWFNSEIYVVETKSLVVIKKITVGKSPSGMICDTKGKYLFISNRDENTVEIYNQSDLNLVNKIKVGNHPYGVFVNKDLLFVVNVLDDSISIVNTSSFATETIKVGDHPYGVVSDLKNHFKKKLIFLGIKNQFGNLARVKIFICQSLHLFTCDFIDALVHFSNGINLPKSQHAFTETLHEACIDIHT